MCYSHIFPIDNVLFFQPQSYFIHFCRGYQKRAAELHNNWRDHFEEQTKKFDEKRTKLIEEIEEDETCQTRFQQTTIKVFARLQTFIICLNKPQTGRIDAIRHA